MSWQQRFLRGQLRLKQPHFEHLVSLARKATENGGRLPEFSAHHVEEADHVLVVDEPAVQQEEFELVRCLSHWRMRNFRNDAMQHGLDVEPSLRADFADNPVLAEVQFLSELFFHGWNIANGVYLIQDGQDLQVLLLGQVVVGQRLRLDALRDVDQQQRALAASHGPFNFIMEVHMARRVHQVEQVLMPVVGVDHGGSLRLDSNASVPFHLQLVEILLGGVPRDGVGDFEEAVGEGGLAVVDVRDDAEIADVLGGYLIGAPVPYDFIHFS